MNAFLYYSIANELTEEELTKIDIEVDERREIIYLSLKNISSNAKLYIVLIYVLNRSPLNENTNTLYQNNHQQHTQVESVLENLVQTENLVCFRESTNSESVNLLLKINGGEQIKIESNSDKFDLINSNNESNVTSDEKSQKKLINSMISKDPNSDLNEREISFNKFFKKQFYTVLMNQNFLRVLAEFEKSYDVTLIKEVDSLKVEERKLSRPKGLESVKDDFQQRASEQKEMNRKDAKILKNYETRSKLFNILTNIQKGFVFPIFRGNKPQLKEPDYISPSGFPESYLESGKKANTGLNKGSLKEDFKVNRNRDFTLFGKRKNSSSNRFNSPGSSRNYKIYNGISPTLLKISKNVRKDSETLKSLNKLKKQLKNAEFHSGRGARKLTGTETVFYLRAGNKGRLFFRYLDNEPGAVEILAESNKSKEQQVIDNLKQNYR